MTAPEYPQTGVPLLDAVVQALTAAFEHGRAMGEGDTIAADAAYEQTLGAIGKAQRLWDQLDVELTAARALKTAAHAGGRPPNARANPGREA